MVFIKHAALCSSALLLGAQHVLAGGRFSVESRRLSKLAQMGIDADGKSMVDGWSSDMRTSSDDPSVASIAAEFVPLSLDHFGTANTTFQNRFWVYDKFYKPGGPIVLYDEGEADAEPYAQADLTSPNSYVRNYLQKNGGMGIAWEHRYYGKSVPAEINTETSPEIMKYLTAEQALADVAEFAAKFSRKGIDGDLTPKGTPWVFVGGSYPGMRAAFMRKFYPETIQMSLSSSGPVEAKVDMSVYFEQVYRGMNAYGFGNCTADIHAAIDYIDGQLANSNTSDAIKVQFLGPAATVNDNAAFADALTTLFYNWQGYGIEGGSGSLRNFCDYIATDSKTGEVSSAEGWAKSKGGKYVADRWAAWTPFVALVNKSYDLSCTKQAGNSTVDCNLGKILDDAGAIAWTWQYCTQWGYFQSANLGPNQIVSKYNSLAHQRDLCHRQFPEALKAGILPDLPRVNETNAHFGGWDIRPSNVYSSGGQFDPWRTLSILSTESDAPNPKLITDVPDCGVETPADQAFGFVLPNAQHCYDLGMGLVAGTTSQNLFQKATDKWLKCFKPQ